jgi:hypothetical protein
VPPEAAIEGDTCPDGSTAPASWWPQSLPRWDPSTEEPEFDLPPGRYSATVALNAEYRDYFQIPAADATINLNVTVVNVDLGAEGLARAKALTRAAAVGDTLATETAAKGEHGEHAGQGDASTQVSAYDPDFRPPARAPRTLAAAPAKGPRPDLRSLPAWGISLEQHDDGKVFVNFGATVWNAGTSPLLVDGLSPDRHRPDGRVPVLLRRASRSR